MRCPRCQHEGEESHRYCAHCGCVLDDHCPTLDADASRRSLEQAKQCYREGRKDDALTLFERLARTVPNVPGEVFNYLGALYSEKGRPKDAVAAFLTSVQHQPNSPNAYFNLGMACRMQGMLAEAVSCFRSALQVKPDFTSAQSALRDVLATASPAVEQLTAEIHTARSAGETPRIRLLAEKLLALDPESLFANLLLVDMDIADNNLLPAYTRATAMVRKHPEATIFSERMKRLKAHHSQHLDALTLLERAKEQKSTWHSSNMIRHWPACRKPAPPTVPAWPVLP